MTEPNPTPQDAGRDAMFSEPGAAGRQLPTTAVGIAVVALVLLGAVFLMLGRRKPDAGSGIYIPNLALSHIEMSESESVSGAKSTFIDGQVRNSGPLTVIAATVAVTFPADGAPGQTQSTALNLIRAREPYIDAAPLSSLPLKPGAEAGFRLIFESFPDTWNQSTPALQVTRVTTK